MTDQLKQPPSPSSDDFARQAGQAEQGFISELWDFMRDNKKWWVTPIVVALLAIGVLLVLSTTAAGPFIYALF